ncbi:DUF1361 domain-containing protein [Brevibacillus daliensis]|uniref:DUF1361 domain-containing protein n=1 Tax=Brevibacillus daliensis TaxID=2892995 RepID=UPI001E5F4317|nr:DUF1361 domain-containing protein [Brevibacillus daliensis]
MTYLITPLLIRLFFVMGLASLGGAILWGFRFLTTGYFTFGWLLYLNLVLAWIPFLLSMLLIYWWSKKERITLSMMSVGLIWLLFLPNATYIVTDIVHLTYMDTRFFIYYDVILNFTFAFTGVALGFLSLAMIQTIVKENWNEMTGWIFAFIIQLLTALGVYLGRFERFNSWDILHQPGQIIADSIIGLISNEGMLFMGSFSVFLMLTYPLFYLIFCSLFKKRW